MIHFLHGNAGLPDDLMPLVLATGQSFNAWHLWRTLADHPEANSFDGFARFQCSVAHPAADLPQANDHSSL